MGKEKAPIVSQKWRWGESFAIRKPDLRVLRLALLILAGYLVLGELFFRLEPVRAGLTGPRFGSQHRQFEIQMARLDKLVEEGEPIDCIFLGNSMIWLGVDPLVVNQAFHSRTGQEIHCFNFGVSALPASSAGQIASMLVERYSPKLLIYGTFARDYAIPLDVEDAYMVSDTPWLRYRNGEFNISGWMYDHSSIFQYKGHIRDYLFMNYLEDVFDQKDVPAYHAYGLDPKYDIRVDVRMAPDFEAVGNRDPVKWLTHFEMKQENLDGLRQIVQQSNRGVEVVVIELPFYETAYEFFSNGRQDYETYVRQVEAITALSQTPFWRLEEQPTLPPDEWWDYFHLNLQGVSHYSAWMGGRLADAYLQGDLKFTSATMP